MVTKLPPLLTAHDLTRVVAEALPPVRKGKYILPAAEAVELQALPMDLAIVAAQALLRRVGIRNPRQFFAERGIELPG